MPSPAISVVRERGTGENNSTTKKKRKKDRKNYDKVDVLKTTIYIRAPTTGGTAMLTTLKIKRSIEETYLRCKNHNLYFLFFFFRCAVIFAQRHGAPLWSLVKRVDEAA